MGELFCTSSGRALFFFVITLQMVFVSANSVFSSKPEYIIFYQTQIQHMTVR